MLQSTTFIILIFLLANWYVGSLGFHNLKHLQLSYPYTTEKFCIKQGFNRLIISLMFNILMW